MLFFYIRHGDPIYRPDSLTPLGERQAEAIARRLAAYGLDRVYSSTSERAIQTATPTCELLKLKPTLLEFAHESLTAADFNIYDQERNTKIWAYQHKEYRALFHLPEVRRMGEEWFRHPVFADHPSFERGVTRGYDEADRFFAGLGYEHIRYTGTYKVTAPNRERVAMFAHQGFGLLFLSCLLDIPYPIFSTQFDMTHTGMTVIDFRENEEGICIPCVLTLSSDGHLYRDGLMTGYNHGVRF